MSEPTTNPKAMSVLRTLQADHLLEGWAILAKLKDICGQMTFRDMTFTAYFDKLQTDISKIGHLQLQHDVDVMTASAYLVDLTMGYERVLDDINRNTIEAQVFLGRLKTIHTRVSNLKKPFIALWSIGAQEILAASSIKIGATEMKDIAGAEFSFVVDDADLDLGAMIEAMDLTIDNLKSLRKLAQDKYAMGKDQVNAALSALDFTDKGIGDEPKSHKPAKGDSATMAGMFGARYQHTPEPSTATGAQAEPEPETEDDLPPSLRTPVTDLDDMPPTKAEVEQVVTGVREAVAGVQAAVEQVKAAAQAGISVSGPEEEEAFKELERRQEAAAPCVAPETPVLTPEGPVAAGELKEGDKVLVAEGLPIEPGVHTVATVIASRDLALTKPEKGKALVVPFHLDIKAPGTLRVPDFLIGKGKTKFELIHQDSPEENGIYRFMGPDVPLERLEDEKPKVKPEVKTVAVSEPEVKPTAEVSAPDTKVVDTPQVPTPEPAAEGDVKTVILSDPFLADKQKTELIAKLEGGDEEDDFPTSTAPAAPEAPAEEEDDFPGAPVATAPASVLDDDDDFPTGQPVVDKTPATQELKAQEDPAPAPAPEPEKPKQVVAPAPTTPAAAPKPGGLFRSRVIPPNQTAAPAFRPSKPIEGAQVSGDGLDEVL